MFVIKVKKYTFMFAVMELAVLQTDLVNLQSTQISACSLQYEFMRFVPTAIKMGQRQKAGLHLYT
jgi:hypothetical protein